ncbi:signal peptidase I [Virgibacillus halotolerans]|uniref:signal peptidase I n=1 Tax=Virgibacillus halotolerans TaxID=1071053 RepID=UPI0019603660|nr:signal peptidase I [Virgibacillus halotolerans]MBM7601662.1 signal peptidase I [Virgibacillus halotolerans]
MMKTKYFRVIIVILFAIGIAYLCRSFVFASYVVDGESMEPTLEDRDLLMVNKVIYSLKDVDQFDVIVFHANKQEDYVKRVIGLPGDRIAYKNDVLYVNGEHVEEPFLHAFVKASHTMPHTTDFDLEEKTGETKVPEGQLFVMGDNREDSLDSRSIGFISIEQIVGKVGIRYWPLSHATFSFGE